jgi:hypothetical protein
MSHPIILITLDQRTVITCDVDRARHRDYPFFLFTHQVDCFALLSYYNATLQAMQKRSRILIYSATDGYRHDSIPTAIKAIQQQANKISVDFDATEDKNQFRNDVLSEYDAVLFLSTIGEG